MKIDWQIPAKRTGLKGMMDNVIGPGATQAEKDLQGYIPLLAGGALLAYGVYAELDWSVIQYLVALLLTIDMVGGVITNATSSAKRWFHREGEGIKAHMAFIAIHFIQLGLLSVFFLDMNFWWVAQTGAFMLLAASIILLTPLYLQRPVAMSLYGLSVLLCLYVFASPVALEWFLPLFYLKLFISHLLREEPYRPETEY